MQLVYADTTSAATKSKNYGFVRQYWKYLQDIGAVPDETRNPFSELSHASKTKIKGIKRTSFTTKEINLLGKTAKEQGDDQLANLVLLAAYTGARIEELCQLKVTSVLRVDGVSCFSIEDAKTEAGNRLVPIHPKLLVLVRRLCKASTDSYLIAGLTETKYGDRSNAIGKRFGRLKTGLGFGEEKVFHSIRKTVTTLLENAGVPEGVAADIVGHEKTTMTYGLYSSGTATKAKYNAVGLLEY
jgi:integrase